MSLLFDCGWWTPVPLEGLSQTWISGSAHSAVILVYGLVQQIQEIRQSLSLWAHCQTPSRLIVGAANLSAEGRQPALPLIMKECHPCLKEKMEMDRALTFVYMLSSPVVGFQTLANRDKILFLVASVTLDMTWAFKWWGSTKDLLREEVSILLN